MKIINFIKKLGLGVLVGVSSVTVALADVASVMDKIKSEILNPVAALLAAVSGIYFLYGVLLYFQSGLNEKELDRAKSHIIWGLLGLVIIYSVSGIIEAITSTIGA
ncbi:MAG: hypothetical protein HZA94_00750 [Candidatus Vogelbacteria bacterium]|nr:hypothetical protein [Candidatus Vogelbacteria bacterium]